jgi:methylglutaconyl-CoA hydratase
LEIALKINEKGPIAVRMAKRAIAERAEVDLRENGLVLEEECYDGVLVTEDRLEGLKAFSEKRKPVYKGK